MDYTKPPVRPQSNIRGIRGKAGLIGIDTVNANLHRVLKEIKYKSLLGMVEASILIRRDMEETPPTIPVDLGNLRASWFTTSRLGGGSNRKFRGAKAEEYAAERTAAIASTKEVVKAQKEPSLIMGFSVNYAAPVHEMIGAKFKRPGSGAKFFQAALSRNTKQIVKIIKASVELPK